MLSMETADHGHHTTPPELAGTPQNDVQVVARVLKTASETVDVMDVLDVLNNAGVAHIDVAALRRQRLLTARRRELTATRIRIQNNAAAYPMLRAGVYIDYEDD